MPNDSIAEVAKAIMPGQPVKAFFGLKRHQWKQKDFYQRVVRDYLENSGVKVVDVQCYLKISARTRPQPDPNVVNLFLRLNGTNSVDIIKLF